MTITYKDMEVEIKILTHYRPAPACSNHDSPSFSDDGDSCEFEILKAARHGVKLATKEAQHLYEDDGFYALVCEADHEERYKDIG